MLLSTIIYLLFVAVFFGLGFFFNGRKQFNLFLLLSLVLPFTNFTTAYHTHFQLSSYLFFFVGALAKDFSPKYYFELYKDLPQHIRRMFTSIGIMFLLYSPMLIEHSLVNILKDIKPYLFIGLVVLFVERYKELLKDVLNEYFLSKVLFWNFIVAICFYFLMFNYDVHLLLENDPYFKNNEVRYSNLASVVLPLILIKMLVVGASLNLRTLIYIIVPLLLTGNRTVVLITFAIVLIHYLRFSKVKLKRVILIALPLFLLSIFVLSHKIANNASLARFKKLGDLQYLKHAISKRLEPLINSFQDYDILNYLLGNGFGHSYYISWFEYRTHINNYNIYIDNIYATLYGKFGLLFFVPLLLFFVVLKKYSNPLLYPYMMVYFVLLGLTNSFLYQSYLPLFLLILAVPFYKVK